MLFLLSESSSTESIKFEVESVLIIVKYGYLCYLPNKYSLPQRNFGYKYSIITCRNVLPYWMVLDITYCTSDIVD